MQRKPFIPFVSSFIRSSKPGILAGPCRFFDRLIKSPLVIGFAGFLFAAACGALLAHMDFKAQAQPFAAERLGRTVLQMPVANSHMVGVIKGSTGPVFDTRQVLPLDFSAIARKDFQGVHRAVFNIHPQNSEQSLYILDTSFAQVSRSGNPHVQGTGSALHAASEPYASPDMRSNSESGTGSIIHLDQKGIVSFSSGRVVVGTETGFMPVSLQPSLSTIAALQNSAQENSSSQGSVSFFYKKHPVRDPSGLNVCLSSHKPGWTGLVALARRFSLFSSSDANINRAGTYKQVVSRYASQYGISPELVLAIMRTESNFNPLAVSPMRAMGLMQVVPETAGEEVYRYLIGLEGTPSEDTLLHPEYNIKYGITYLHLLANRHFQGVLNKTSRELCTIAAYNGGPGAVLRVFDKTPEAAVAVINSLTSAEVYERLVNTLPKEESRRYVDTVLGHWQSFSESGRSL